MKFLEKHNFLNKAVKKSTGAEAENKIDPALIHEAKFTDLADQEPVSALDAKGPTQPDSEIENIEPALDLDYRSHLEKIKSQDSNIKGVAYAEFENTREGLDLELGNLTDALLAENLTKEVKDNLTNNLRELALKTGLSEKEIKEIYQDNEEAIIAEAKAEINKNTSKWKSAGLIAAKTTLYIGAGLAAATSTAATLGVGGLAGGGIIAAARMVDRLITEKIGKNKLDKKVKEIKAGKGKKEKETIQDRLAAAISLKKKIEISHVDLNAKGDRAKLIDDYIEEQSKAGKLGIEPKELLKYKDQIIRVMEGLDDIDKFNQEKEAKLNKKSFSDGLTKLEKKISGETSGERIASTAVLISMGIAARSIPGVRQILAAYAGYRFGGAAIDYLTKEKKEDVNSANEINNQEQYGAARRKLLDKNFQKNNPQEYLQLKSRVDAIENQMLSGGAAGQDASALNKNFDSKIKTDKQYNRGTKLARGTWRVAGAAAGLVGGELISEFFKHNKISDLFKHNQPKSESAGAADKIAGSSVKSAGMMPERPGQAGGMKADATMVKTPGGLRADSSDIIHKSVETTPAAPGAKASAFEDVISNRGLKPGQHDSIWRSTEQIFRDHAQELGYNKNSGQSFEDWVQTQTAKTINNSGDLTDKVFEKNIAILKHDASGNNHIEIKKDGGLTPGYLAETGADHQAPAPGINIQDNTSAGIGRPDLNETAFKNSPSATSQEVFDEFDKGPRNELEIQYPYPSGDNKISITPENQQQIQDLFGRLQKPGSVDINAFRKEFAALKGGPLNYQEESGIQDIIQNKNITQDSDSPLLRERFVKLVGQMYESKGVDATRAANIADNYNYIDSAPSSEHIGSHVEIGKGTADTDPFASKHDPKLHYSKNVNQPVTETGKNSGGTPEINLRSNAGENKPATEVIDHLQKAGSNTKALHEELEKIKGASLSKSDEELMEIVIRENQRSPKFSRDNLSLLAQRMILEREAGNSNVAEQAHSLAVDSDSHTEAAAASGKETADADPFASKHDPKLHYSKNVDQPVTETGKGSGASETNKSGGDKSATPEVAGAKPKVEVEVPISSDSKKIFSSMEDLRGLPEGTTAKLGELSMVKHNNFYQFTTEKGDTIKMAFNKFGGFEQNDKFGIFRDGHVLDGKTLNEAIPFKQLIYDNLPDKKTSLAKDLLAEITKNKGEAEFLKGF